MNWFETSASNKDLDGLRGEKKWKWDKDGINTALKELTLLEVANKSFLLVSLYKQSYFDETYAEVLDRLRSKLAVTEVTAISSDLLHLSVASTRYKAVVVTDPSVMNRNACNSRETRRIRQSWWNRNHRISLH